MWRSWRRWRRVGRARGSGGSGRSRGLRRRGLWIHLECHLLDFEGGLSDQELWVVRLVEGDGREHWWWDSVLVFG